MKILITGIAGLLGSNFARFVRDYTNDEVVGIDDLSCGLEANVPRDISWHRRRIGRGECDRVFEDEKPDIVYHFAAYAAECLSPFVRCYNYQNNLVATAEVVNACLNHRVQRLMFTSSMAVYGDGDPPFAESHACRPMDPYGVAKLACEQDIRIAGEQHGLDWCVLRPHNIYGPGQVCTQRYRNVFGIWMWRHMHGEPLLIYGDGSQQRAFTSVGDIMLPLYLAGTRRNASRQVINLGGSAPTTINQAAHALCDVMGGCPIEYREGRHEVHQAWCTTEKSARLLGYKDLTPLGAGLQAMWDWAQRTDQASAPTPPIEVEDGLPSYWVSQPTNSGRSFHDPSELRSSHSPPR
ncbi:MAG: NAD-dependent epimerase/dehydratase family protein [Pirellulaceae bacterium]